MISLPSILSNRTIWANLVGLAALGLAAAGFDTSSFDANGLTDSILQIVAGASFVLSTIFHLKQKAS